MQNGTFDASRAWYNHAGEALRSLVLTKKRPQWAGYSDAALNLADGYFSNHKHVGVAETFIDLGGGSAATPGQKVILGQSDPHKPGFDPKSVKFLNYFGKVGAAATAHSCYVNNQSTTNNSHEVNTGTLSSIRTHPTPIASPTKSRMRLIARVSRCTGTTVWRSGPA